MQEMYMQEVQQKLQISRFRYGTNTTHIESKDASQIPKYLITVLIGLCI